MATMKEIRNRIRSISNTGQITKAMKMVAAANLRKVQAAMEPLRIYSTKSRELLVDLLASGEDLHSLFAKKPYGTEKHLYVMLVGNRGLCGMYNMALVQFAKKILAEKGEDYDLIVLGRWGKDVIANMEFRVKETVEDISDIPAAAESNRIADRLKRMYRERSYAEIHILYQSYVSAMRQEPVDYLLFPFSLSEEEKKENADEEYFFEPDREEVIDRLIEQYIDNTLLSILQEAKCGEHMARMTAMTNANENIDELISKLQISYNRARQESITNEISEIVGGAAALKEKG